MNNVEMNNNSNPVQTKEKKKMNKLVYVIILILVVLVCYFAGYFVGTKLKEDDKANNNDVVEENNKEAEEEFVEDDFVDDEEYVEDEEEYYEEDEGDYEEESCYEGLGVVFEYNENKKEKEAIKVGSDLYTYGLSALTCNKFDYGNDEMTSNGFLVKNFEQVNSKFTKNNLVDLLAGGDDFEAFKESMEITKKNGNYYMQHQCDRGSNLYHRGTIVQLVSFNDTEIKMEATSFYEEEEKLMTVEKYEFIVQKEAGEWKIAKMTLPY